MPGMSPATALDVREGDDVFEVHLCPTWYRKPGEIRLKKNERIKSEGRLGGNQWQRCIYRFKSKKRS
jgi:hypothetical protein